MKTRKRIAAVLCFRTIAHGVTLMIPNGEYTLDTFLCYLVRHRDGPISFLLLCCREPQHSSITNSASLSWEYTNSSSSIKLSRNNLTVKKGWNIWHAEWICMVLQSLARQDSTIRLKRELLQAVRHQGCIYVPILRKILTKL